MKREEFLNQLEYLLQDIAEEEKRDAIEYYRDYLDEAGPENEESVLAGFESPERIAAFIRTDLLGGMDKGGEFTENGYEDKRFNTSALPMVREKPEGEERQDNTAYEDSSYEKGSYEKGSYEKGCYEKGSYEKDAERGGSKKAESHWLKYILIAFGLLIAAPIIFSLSMGLLGGAIGVGSVLLALFLVLAIFTIVGFSCGIGLVIFGIVQLITDVWSGVLIIGVGIAFTGAGCLFLVLAVLFYGRFLPWAVKGIIGLVRRIFGKGTRRIKKSEEE